MGLLEESGGRTLLQGGFDPHERPLHVARVNGTAQIEGRQFELAGGAGGSVEVTAEGVVTLDPGGIPPVAPGEVLLAGIFTYRLGNGVAESHEQEARVEVVGQVDTGPAHPPSAFLAVSGADVALDGAGRVERWLDQTGNGNHLYQDDSAKRPVLSADENGAMRIYQIGPNHEHLKVPSVAVPRDSGFHAVFAFREDSPQRGQLFSQHFPVQRLGTWWEGLATSATIQSGSADFLEIHNGDQMFEPDDNQGEFGEAHRETNVVLVRGIYLDTSTGYQWQDVRLLASRDASDSALDATYNLTGSIFAVAFFTDWADSDQAIAWATDRIANNAVPVADDLTLNFDAGANQ